MTIYDELFEVPGRTVLINPPPWRVHASLRLFHEDLDPEELTETFGIRPTRSHRKGDCRIDKRGRRFSPFRKGSWRLDSETHVQAKDIDSHILWILDEMSHCVGAIHKLQALGYDTDVMCGWFANADNTCPSLEVETMRRLSVFRLACWFDVYLLPPDD
jgi:hypothetical protein